MCDGCSYITCQVIREVVSVVITYTIECESHEPFFVGVNSNKG